MVERRSPKPHVVGSSPAGPAILIYRLFDQIMKLKEYLQETGQELSKVTWPDRKKVLLLVVVILVMVTIIFGYVILVDSVLSFLTNLLKR